MKITYKVLDIPDLSVGIILGLDSSSIKAVQRVKKLFNNIF